MRVSRLTLKLARGLALPGRPVTHRSGSSPEDKCCLNAKHKNEAKLKPGGRDEYITLLCVPNLPELTQQLTPKKIEGES